MKPMKNVVAVNGSPRRATTEKLLNEIAKLLEAHQIQMTTINMGEYQVGDCTGCELCIRKTGQCHQEDDAQKILAQLEAADGIILASPVYLMNITGRLKSLIDKTASWVHRSPMVGKPMLSVATTAGAGLKEVHTYLEKVGVQWGMHPTGKIGRSAMNQDPPTKSEVSKFVWHLNNPTSSYKPSLNQLIQYQVQKVMALKVSKIDSEYWEERGWDKELYYYPARISWINRIIAGIFYKFLYSRIKPVNTY